VATIGIITPYAVDILRQSVFASCPRIGKKLVERLSKPPSSKASKAASDIYAPIAGL